MVENNEYSDVTFNVLDNLATDVIIGKIFKEHERYVYPWGTSPSIDLKCSKENECPIS